MTTPEDGWQRLDPMMVLVYPVTELIKFIPVLFAVVVLGSASSGAEWWQLAAVAIPVGLGVLRYFTTYYRITPGRIELRRGLVNRHLLSTPLDRVRTVDITSPPIHRLLGLSKVRIGTGTASKDDEDRLDLDGLRVDQARQLRSDLLHVAPDAEPADESAPREEPVLEFDPAWVRFAPLTSTGLVITAGVIGVVSQTAGQVGAFQRFHPERLVDDAAAWSVWVAIPIALVGLAVVVSLLSIAGYLLTNYGFRLTHTGPARGGAWHLRRGLITTRETTLDDERVHGVSVGEPLGLRLAGGGRAWAIVTGLGDGESALLVPPAPREVVHRAAGGVLRTAGPLDVELVEHGPRARTRRFTRAVGPAVLVLLVAVLLVPLADAPVWIPAVAAVGVPAAVALAADRARALGHALHGGYVVTRSGSLNRRRDALETAGVIGWNQRATWFQRRVGLTTLVATTAGGRQAVTALDVPEDTATALAHAAHRSLIEQFLE